MARSDRQKVIDFISSQLPDGEGTLVLASGPDGDVVATVAVHGDDLEIRSNLPEWVDAREVYEHLRWRVMPSWEQRAWLRATVTPAAGKPSWDGGGGVLSLGRRAWRFRRQDGPVVRLLDELHRLGWPRSVLVANLDPSQVREAARGLRKTRPAIEWTAADDGHLSWRLTHI